MAIKASCTVSEEEAQHPPAITTSHSSEVCCAQHPVDLPCCLLYSSGRNMPALVQKMCCCKTVTVTLSLELVIIRTGWHGLCESTLETRAHSGVQAIISPSQAVPETALEQDAQTDVEDELEAPSPCRAELETSQATEQRDQGALVIYQPPLQGISSAKATAAGDETLLAYTSPSATAVTLDIMLKCITQLCTACLTVDDHDAWCETCIAT